jgi:hypothetical protein
VDIFEVVQKCKEHKYENFTTMQDTQLLGNKSKDDV